MGNVLRVVACLGVGLLFTACGSDDTGPSDAVAACKQVVHQVCQKFYSCYSSAQLAPAADLVGSNEAECETKFLDCSPEATSCDPGKSYHSDTANTCINEFGALTCGQLMGLSDGSTNTPASCDSVCR